MTERPDCTDLPKLLVDAITSGKVLDGSNTLVPLQSNISLDEALTLYQVIREVKPRCSAEVGFAQGISALAILKALEDNDSGLHHVMDPFQDRFGDIGLAMVCKAGLNHRMKFHRKFAEEVFPTLPALQFVFIDSSHLFDLTLLEFVLADKKLEVGGVVAFHDMWMPSLQSFIRYVLANRAYEVVSKVNQPASLPRFSVKQRLKLCASNLFRNLQGSRSLFREEVLQPWFSMGIPNIILLRKTAEDKRDWQFHVRF